jgi:acetyl esterase/lipase
MIRVQLLLLAATFALAQRGASLNSPQTIPLWPGAAPGALGDSPSDIPTLTIYLPAGRPDPMTAVIIMPGGGYTKVADNAGPPTASYLNSLGVAAFVLTYRVAPKYRHPVELGDAQRAVRLVRARASAWHLAPDRVGVAGFSSGGHLASTVSTHFDAGDPKAADPVDRESSRPDFAILASSDPTLDEGDAKALLGDHPDPVQVSSLSNQTQVTARTPLTFLFSTNEDSPESSVEYFLALRKAGVPAELHVFKDGAHGIAAWGMQNPDKSEWPHVLANWLRSSGFVK